MKKLLVTGCLLLVLFPLMKGAKGMWLSYKLLVDRFWFGIHYPNPYSHYTPISLIPIQSNL